MFASNILIFQPLGAHGDDLVAFTGATFVDETINRPLWTYDDTLDHLMDFVGANSGGKDMKDCRRAAREALDEMPKIHRWNHYYYDHTFLTNAPYSTGTITYDHTGHASGERIMTLDSGVWPSWIALGRVLVNSLDYRVEQKLSSTEIQLHSDMNPGADIASGTSYNAYQNEYPIHDLYMNALGDLVESANNRSISYVHPREWLDETKLTKEPSYPVQYTIMGSQNYMNVSNIFIAPPPDAQRSYSLIIQRRSRELELEKYDTGTVTVTTDTAVSGTGTAWSAKHVGSVIRISDNTTAPTGKYGSNVFQEERVITKVTNATTATVDRAWTAAQTSVAYNMSDPVDLNLGVMLNLYLRTCEMKLAVHRRPKDRNQIAAEWEAEFGRAKSADKQYAGPRKATGRGRRMPSIMSRSGLGADIE